MRLESRFDEGRQIFETRNKSSTSWRRVCNASSTNTASVNPDGPGPSTDTGPSTGAKVDIGVGADLSTLMLLAVDILFSYRRHIFALIATHISIESV